MSTITSEVMVKTTFTNGIGPGEEFIFSEKDEEVLWGMYSAYLLVNASRVLDVNITTSGVFEWKSSGVSIPVTIGVQGDEVTYKTDAATYVLSMDELYFIVSPFGMYLPSLASHTVITEPFGVPGKKCWLLEDLNGYEEGLDSDIWLLAEEGILIKCDEVDEGGERTLKANAAYGLNKLLKEGKAANGEEILESALTASKVNF